MAALTAHVNRVTKEADNFSFKIKNAQQVYFGGFQSILAGYLQPFAGAASEMLMGRAVPTPVVDLGTPGFGATGNTTQVPECQVALGPEIMPQVSVTNVAAITDIGDIVYLNSTDNDFTTTRPARGIPFGVVVRWWSSTTCDVRRFSYGELCAIMLAGNGSDTVCLGSFTPTTAASAITVAAVTLPYRSRIRTIYAQVGPVALTGGTSVTLTGSKGGVAFTAGGVISLTTNAAGALVSSTAITQDSLATLSESDTLNLSWTSVGTYTAGTFTVFATVDHQLGI